MSAGPAAAVERRRGGRARKISERIGKVGEADLRQAAAARLDALENDGATPNRLAPPDLGAGGSDDEYLVPGDSDSDAADREEAPGGAASAKRRSRGSASVKKRGSAADKDSRGDGTPQSFAQLLSEATPIPAQALLSPCAIVLGRQSSPAALHDCPPGRPTYLTAAAEPPRTCSARKFCSVCGNVSGYNCKRCTARFCSRKCLGVHTETRCLKSIS